MSGESPYQHARREAEGALRRTLLDAASGLLVNEGPQALTMRRIASVVGCSTTVLYRLFGSKEGIANALYREGFERLTRRLEQAAEEQPSDAGPMERAAALARTYRASALADPNYYGVMFGSAIPGFRPSSQAVEVGNGSLRMLAAAVREAMDEGVLADGDAQAAAEVMWAAAHGVVSLELAGHLDGDVAAERYATLVRAAVTPFLAGATEEAQR